MAFADLKNDYELTEVPADLTPGPFGEALEIANQAKFTVEELQAYEKTRDEIRQVLEIAKARWAEGIAEGETRRGRGQGEGGGHPHGPRGARRRPERGGARAHRCLQGCRDARSVDCPRGHGGFGRGDRRGAGVTSPLTARA